MELLESYQKFAETIDQCNDIEELQEYRKANTMLAMRDEFWKQRQLSIDSEDPLEKQRAQVKLQWLQRYFGSQIPARRSINRFAAPNGLYGIFITSKAALGTGCTVFPQVTIAADTSPDSPYGGFPVIGNNVYISVGATIIGNVVIGDNVRIAPNCCVTTDVPSNSIVTGDGIVIEHQETPLETRHYTAEQFFKRRFSMVIYDYNEHIDDPQLTIRMATLTDIDAIIQLYKERVTWFKWKKLSQWTHYLQNHPKEEFMRKIELGEYYVVLKDDEIVGGLALSTDSEQWMDDTANAFYLCRVVSKIGYKNLGNYMAEEAKRLAKEAGKEFLRLECVYANTKLNETWEKLGFAFIRDVEDRYHSSLREYVIQ